MGNDSMIWNFAAITQVETIFQISQIFAKALKPRPGGLELKLPSFGKFGNWSPLELWQQNSKSLNHSHECDINQTIKQNIEY